MLGTQNTTGERRDGGPELMFDRDTMRLIRERGYPAEEHFAPTPDGWILVLHRIPHGIGSDDDEGEMVRLFRLPHSTNSQPL